MLADVMSIISGIDASIRRLAPKLLKQHLDNKYIQKQNVILYSKYILKNILQPKFGRKTRKLNLDWKNNVLI